MTGVYRRLQGKLVRCFTSGRGIRTVLRLTLYITKWPGKPGCGSAAAVSVRPGDGRGSCRGYRLQSASRDRAAWAPIIRRALRVEPRRVQRLLHRLQVRHL